MADVPDEIDLDWEEWRPEEGSFLSHVLAGSVAGITEHTLMFPVDTLKTHVQCDHCGKKVRAAGAAECTHAFKTLVNREGIARLWRGVGTMFLACVPAHAAYFSIYESTKQRLGANQPGHHPIAAAASGVLATLAHDSIMTPMDTVKQRLQLGYYRGIRHCFKHMLTTEGIGAFYVALPTTLLMNLPFGAIMVTTNESLKKLLTGPNGERHMGTYLAAGSGAGAAAAVATTPLDMIKTRLQTQHMGAAGSATPGEGGAAWTPTSAGSVRHGKHQHSLRTTRLAQTRNAMTAAVAVGVGEHTRPAVRLTGFVDAAVTIYNEAGALGFMRGLLPRLIVTTPSVAISWTAYESAKSLIAGRL